MVRSGEKVLIMPLIKHSSPKCNCKSEGCPKVEPIKGASLGKAPELLANIGLGWKGWPKQTLAYCVTRQLRSNYSVLGTATEILFMEKRSSFLWIEPVCSLPSPTHKRLRTRCGIKSRLAMVLAILTGWRCSSCFKDFQIFFSILI